MDFFTLSKWGWALVSPDFLLVAMVVCGVGLLLAGARKKAGWLLGMTALTMAGIAFMPVGKWVVHPLEIRFPATPQLPDTVHGIIVLAGSEDAIGSSLWHQPELYDGGERLFTFLELIGRYPTAVRLFAGGTGSLKYPDLKQSEVAKKIFRQAGADLSGMVVESGSRNTYEGAIMARELVRPQPGENWVLITAARHMPRSVGVFEKAGWPVIPYPVDHWTRPRVWFEPMNNFSAGLRMLKAGVYEWVGLVAYRATGKTLALFPGPR